MKGLLFTYILTFGGSLASLFWPFYGLLIYICFAILKPDSMWGFALPQLNYSRIVAMAMLVGWAGHSFGKWRFGRASLPVYALLGYYLWGVGTSFIAPNSDLAWRWVESMFKIVLPFMVGITLIESIDQLKKVAWVIIVSLGYVAWEMYWSYATGNENHMIAIDFGGMDNNTWSIAMVCGAGLAFFLGLHETVGWRRWLAFVCAGLMAHVPMFGDSRGGMLALIITGIVAAGIILMEHFGWIMGGKSRLRPTHFAFFAVAILIGLAMAGERVRERFASIFVPQEELDPSAKGRTVLWGQCFDLMLSNPVLGVGPDHFGETVKDLWGGARKEAHSLWLQSGAEMGLPGMLMLMTFYGSIVWRLWKMLVSKQQLDPWLRDAAQMVIAAIIGFAVSASFVTVEGVEPPYYVAMIGCGLLKLASTQAQAVQQPANRAVGQARVYQPVG